MATNACNDTGVKYIYIILVDGVISKDGYFDEDDMEEAERVAKRYKNHYNVKLMKVRSYRPISPQS